MVRFATRMRGILRRAVPAQRDNQGLSWAVQQALALSPEQLTPPTTSAEFAEYLSAPPSSAEHVSFEDLFFLNGMPLPCWEETHQTLYGSWLTASDNYPVYYALFRRLTQLRPVSRMLEIGVFTGYSGTVFARAAQGAAFYLGVDSNEYLSYGLELASRTFKILRLELRAFDFALIEGRSSNPAVQRSILLSGPYDLVHVDGDHTLVGKLIDLELARQAVSTRGVVLVDDYDHHACVPDAIQRSIAMGWFTEFAYIPKMRGLAALRAWCGH